MLDSAVPIAISIYLVGAFVLLLFMYLIARFYRSRLDPKTPVVGFLLGMISILIGIIGIWIGNGAIVQQIFVDTMLVVAGAFGTWNSIALYIRMKRVYK